LYVQHIRREVWRLKTEAKLKAKRARKRKILDEKATTLQALMRGYIVRNGYRESDKRLRSNDSHDIDDTGLSLMDSVRKRMDIRQRIEMLKQQISATKNSGDSDSETNDEVSVFKVERLKERQKKLQIKAKTLKAVTRPLQEKFDDLRAEHEKLRKKYRKMETKNETRRTANESAAELLEEKMESIQELNSELNTTLSSEKMEKFSQERTKAMKKVDAMLETANAYANRDMNERDASVFAGEVARIGREAHRKAKLIGDSLRSHMATNLSKYGSNRNLTNIVEDRSAAETTTTSRTTGISKTGVNLSPQRDVGLSPGQPKRGHGRVLTNLLRDRSRNSLMNLSDAERSVSPTPQRRDEHFMKTSRMSNSTQTLLRRQGSLGSILPKIITTTSSNKPMRRIKSADRTPNAQLQRRDLGLRRVLSERKMLPSPSSPMLSSKLDVLRKELRDEVRSSLRKDLLQRDECRQPRRRSGDRSRTTSPAAPKRSPKGSKKKAKGSKSITPTRSKQVSRTRNRDETPTHAVAKKKNNNNSNKEQNLAKTQPQSRQAVSLTAPTIEIRKNKRTYLRRAATLTESSKGRRRIVDMGMEESLGSGGMMPNLE